MNSIRAAALPALCGLLSAMGFGGDLSTYRNFKIGMDLPAVTRGAGLDSSGAKTVHLRPALIQEIEWHPGLFGASSQDEAARNVLFTFYNGELFQIAVTYDRYRTEGMSPDDLIEAISATYGARVAGMPAAEAVSPGANGSERAESVARWEDAESVLSLERSEYGPGFRLVLVSRRVGALARAAMAEAARLDLQEAPHREAERLRKQAESGRSAQEKARLANKPKFRP